jgi:transposase
MHEAILAAKRTRPTLSVRQIAAIFGVGKSQVGRVLKAGLSRCCSKCGRKYAGK